MSTMRAITIDGAGGPEILTLSTVPRPVCVNSEFLVKIVAAGINPIDAKTRAGRGVTAAITNWPVILGMDFSGVVERSPYAAHPLQPGDEVYGLIPVPRLGGSYAEYAAVPSLSIARKPAALSHVEAAAVPLAALTAWGMVVDVARAHEGQRMLVHAGAGGVGHFAVQFGNFFGAHVIATGSTRNSSWLRELGAREVVDYSTTRFEDEISAVDVVIDLVGNVHDDTGTRSLAVLRPGGLIVNAPTNSWPTLLEDAAAAGMRATDFTTAPDGSTLAIISRLLDSGDIRVFVDRVFEFEKVADAHRALEEGHTRGKTVLAVSEV